MIFGVNKIHVNVPRFQREWNDNPRAQYVNHQGENHHVPAPQNHQHQNRRVHRVEPRVESQNQVMQVWKRKEGTAGEGNNFDGQEPNHQEAMNQRNIGQQVLPVISHRKYNSTEVIYHVPKGEMEKFKKMYVGTVKTPGSTFSVQQWFNMRGFFLIKVIPLGANKVLLEELEDGVIAALMDEYKDWLYERFNDIRGWNPDVADNERVVWVRCHGIPAHVWNEDFFASLVRDFGEYMGVDEATRTKSAMGVARIMLRTSGFEVFNEVVKAKINDSLFHIKIIEEWCGPLQWIDNCCRKCNKKDDDSGDSSDSDDSHGEGPPLFTVEEEWCNDEDEEGEGDDGEEVSDNEVEGVNENDEESKVQETVDIQEGLRGNDGEKGEEVAPIVDVVVGKEQTLNVTIIKDVEGESDHMTHVSNTGGIGGVQSDVDLSVKTVGGKIDLADVSNKEGCVNQMIVSNSVGNGVRQDEGVTRMATSSKKRRRTRK